MFVSSRDSMLLRWERLVAEVTRVRQDISRSLRFLQLPR